MKSFIYLSPIEEIQKDLERQTKGWKLFFGEPSGVDYQFVKPLEGYPWDCTFDNLKDTMIKVTKIEGHYKHHVLTFKHDDKIRFMWFSWINLLYDTSSKKKYKPKGSNLIAKIYDIIESVLTEEEKLNKRMLEYFKKEAAYEVYDSKGNYIAGFPTFIRACGYKYKFGNSDWYIKY